MIRLEPLGLPQNRTVMSSWQDLPEAFISDESKDKRMIRRNGNPCGVFMYRAENDTVFLKIYFVPGTDDRKKLLALITERMIRNYHPSKIVIEEPSEDLYEVCTSNSFHQNGANFEKTIEPWRKILNDRVFDDEGFIINQGLMKDIPFGWFDTKAKGCGWIAAWNLLKMMGKETDMERCGRELEKGAFLGELMGENLFSLYRWLKKQGLNVSMSLPSNISAKKKIRQSPCGIILYSHSRGAHYVVYRNLGKNRVQIYNAVYGRKNHVISADEFMKEFTLFPTSVVIAVRQGS